MSNYIDHCLCACASPFASSQESIPRAPTVSPMFVVRLSFKKAVVAGSTPAFALGTDAFIRVFYGGKGATCI